MDMTIERIEQEEVFYVSGLGWPTLTEAMAAVRRRVDQTGENITISILYVAPVKETVQLVPARTLSPDEIVDVYVDPTVWINAGLKISLIKIVRIASNKGLLAAKDMVEGDKPVWIGKMTAQAAVVMEAFAQHDKSTTDLDGNIRWSTFAPTFYA